MSDTLEKAKSLRIAKGHDKTCKHLAGGKSLSGKPEHVLKAWKAKHKVVEISKTLADVKQQTL